MARDRTGSHICYSVIQFFIELANTIPEILRFGTLIHEETTCNVTQKVAATRSPPSLVFNSCTFCLGLYPSYIELKLRSPNILARGLHQISGMMSRVWKINKLKYKI